MTSTAARHHQALVRKADAQTVSRKLVLCRMSMKQRMDAAVHVATKGTELLQPLAIAPLPRYGAHEFYLTKDEPAPTATTLLRTMRNAAIVSLSQ